MIKKSPSVCAVTLNWNRSEDTIACLRSLAAQTYPELQTIVVDNGSTDDSLARIGAACPNAQLIAHGENSGFAGGMNLGIRKALAQGAEYVFILNNDTFLAEDVVAKLITGMAGNFAALAPIIYYADAPKRVWSVGGMINPWLLETKENPRGVHDESQWTAVQKTAVLERDFVPACGLMLTRDILQKTGGFDERFFMYYEDLDFCLRIRETEQKIGVMSTAKMWHKVSLSSGGSDSANERYWMARSSVLYFRKHARPYQWPLILFWRTGSALRTTWRLGRAAKGVALQAYWRGLWHGLRERPS